MLNLGYFRHSFSSSFRICSTQCQSAVFIIPNFHWFFTDKLIFFFQVILFNKSYSVLSTISQMFTSHIIQIFALNCFKCPTYDYVIYEMSELWISFSWKMSLLWNVMSMKCLIYEMSYLCNVFIYKMSYLWNVFLWNVFLWNVFLWNLFLWNGFLWNVPTPLNLIPA